jgi:hypothetical protein
MADALEGQLTLFGGLCPACGGTQAYVRRMRPRQTFVLRCVTCDAPVRDVMCGCASQR